MNQEFEENIVRFKGRTMYRTFYSLRAREVNRVILETARHIMKKEHGKATILSAQANQTLHQQYSSSWILFLEEGLLRTEREHLEMYGLYPFRGRMFCTWGYQRRLSNALNRAYYQIVWNHSSMWSKTCSVLNWKLELFMVITPLFMQHKSSLIFWARV